MSDATDVARAAIRRLRVVVEEAVGTRPLAHDLVERALILAAGSAGADPVKFVIELDELATAAEERYTRAGREQARLAKEEAAAAAFARDALILRARAGDKEWQHTHLPTLRKALRPETWQALVHMIARQEARSGWSGW